jgi:hypothetical protein
VSRVYVRNWHDKQHNFEVVVGKCMATDRDDRYFGLVRSQDEHPRRRFRDVLLSQGLPVSQTVTMLTDGGDSVRALAGELSHGAVTILDWFHIAMRMTGLGQYAKGLAHHNPVEALALQHRLERIKWRLWHGDGDEALSRAQALAADVAALNSGYPAPGQKPRHGFERDYLRRPTLPSHCLSAMCPMPTNSSRVL